MTKHLNYMSRTFDDYREDFLKFTRQYYPDFAPTLEDYSVGSWFVDLAAGIGDNLSYYIDRAYQDTQVNTTQNRSVVCNMARMNGFRIPGPKASVTEMEISCLIPILSTSKNSEPDFGYAPKVMRDTIFACGDYQFQLAEDVDFAEQFNKDGYSNRIYYPILNTNGAVIGYQIKKTVIAYGYTYKIYRKEIVENDLKPFMEIVLPDNNVGSVESVIFKENSDITYTPDFVQFGIEEDEFKYRGEAYDTYHYYEVDSLSDQYRYGPKVSRPEEELWKNEEIFDEYTYKPGIPMYRIYRGQWYPVTQKYITEYTDNGYLKIIFGAGSEYAPEMKTGTQYSKHQISNILNNGLMGILPKEGWTMFVLYTTVNGINSNLPVNSINTVNGLKYTMPCGAKDDTVKNAVIRSISGTNITKAFCGKDAPSTEELKWMMRYDTSSQNRATTIKDYRARIVQMPAKYGGVFRNQVAEENNKVCVYLMNVDNNGHLDSVIPQTYVNNLISYLSHYKHIGDYIEIKSGKIVNLAINIEMYVDKNYTISTVVREVIEKVRDYFDVKKRDMGEDLHIGDLEREITSVAGALSVIDTKVYNMYGGSYSSYRSRFPRKCAVSCESVDDEEFTTEKGGYSFQIDTEIMDFVLQADPDVMFEIKYPDQDIRVKVKVK